MPITLTLAPDKEIRSLYLVVDENPSPIAAHIVFGPAGFPTRSRCASASTSTPTCTRWPRPRMGG